MTYAIVIAELSEEDGSGYVGLVPDLNGCMSDGETPQEALENTQQAIADWIAVQTKMKRSIPLPGSAIQRAKREREGMLKALHAMVESYDDLDGRLDALEEGLKELLEAAGHESALDRFERLTGQTAAFVRPLSVQSVTV